MRALVCLFFYGCMSFSSNLIILIYAWNSPNLFLKSTASNWPSIRSAFSIGSLFKPNIHGVKANTTISWQRLLNRNAKWNHRQTKTMAQHTHTQMVSRSINFAAHTICVLNCHAYWPAVCVVQTINLSKRQQHVVGDPQRDQVKDGNKVKTETK